MQLQIDIPDLSGNRVATALGFDRAVTIDGYGGTKRQFISKWIRDQILHRVVKIEAQIASDVAIAEVRARVPQEVDIT